MAWPRGPAHTLWPRCLEGNRFGDGRLWRKTESHGQAASAQSGPELFSLPSAMVLLGLVTPPYPCKIVLSFFLPDEHDFHVRIVTRATWLPVASETRHPHPAYAI